MVLVVVAALAIAPARVLGAEDVALVSQVGGEVVYTAEGLRASRVKPFMRVRAGDRFALAPGASIRLVFIRNARQETWRGPSAFRVGPESGQRRSGEPPEVVAISAVSQQRIARVPELIQVPRLGGVTVRGTARAHTLELSAEQRQELAQARTHYRTMRAEAAADDITPELVMLPLLHEFEQGEELRTLFEEMKRRAPGSPEVKEVAGWLDGGGDMR